RRSAFAVAAAMLLASLAGCRGTSEVAHGQPSGPAGPQASTNWSGYVRTGAPHSFTKITATWVVPSVNCPDGSDTASSTWTGIGGGTTADPTLVQAGTEQDCNGGPSY